MAATAAFADNTSSKLYGAWGTSNAGKQSVAAAGFSVVLAHPASPQHLQGGAGIEPLSEFLLDLDHVVSGTSAPKPAAAPQRREDIDARLRASTSAGSGHSVSDNVIERAHVWLEQHQETAKHYASPPPRLVQHASVASRSPGSAQYALIAPDSAAASSTGNTNPGILSLPGSPSQLGHGRGLVPPAASGYTAAAAFLSEPGHGSSSGSKSKPPATAEDSCPGNGSVLRLLRDVKERTRLLGAAREDVAHARSHAAAAAQADESSRLDTLLASAAAHTGAGHVPRVGNVPSGASVPSPALSLARTYGDLRPSAAPSEGDRKANAAIPSAGGRATTLLQPVEAATAEAGVAAHGCAAAPRMTLAAVAAVFGLPQPPPLPAAMTATRSITAAADTRPRTADHAADEPSRSRSNSPPPPHSSPPSPSAFSPLPPEQHQLKRSTTATDASRSMLSPHLSPVSQQLLLLKGKQQLHRQRAAAASASNALLPLPSSLQSSAPPPPPPSRIPGARSGRATAAAPQLSAAPPPSAAGVVLQAKERQRKQQRRMQAQTTRRSPSPRSGRQRSPRQTHDEHGALAVLAASTVEAASPAKSPRRIRRGRRTGGTEEEEDGCDGTVTVGPADVAQLESALAAYGPDLTAAMVALPDEAAVRAWLELEAYRCAAIREDLGHARARLAEALLELDPARVAHETGAAVHASSRTLQLLPAPASPAAAAGAVRTARLGVSSPAGSAAPAGGSPRGLGGAAAHPAEVISVGGAVAFDLEAQLRATVAVTDQLRVLGPSLLQSDAIAAVLTDKTDWLRSHMADAAAAKHAQLVAVARELQLQVPALASVVARRKATAATAMGALAAFGPRLAPVRAVEAALSRQEVEMAHELQLVAQAEAALTDDIRRPPPLTDAANAEGGGDMLALVLRGPPRTQRDEALEAAVSEATRLEEDRAAAVYGTRLAHCAADVEAEVSAAREAGEARLREETSLADAAQQTEFARRMQAASAGAMEAARRAAPLRHAISACDSKLAQLRELQRLKAAVRRRWATLSPAAILAAFGVPGTALEALERQRVDKLAFARIHARIAAVAHSPPHAAGGGGGARVEEVFDHRSPPRVHAAAPHTLLADASTPAAPSAVAAYTAVVGSRAAPLVAAVPATAVAFGTAYVLPAGQRNALSAQAASAVVPPRAISPFRQSRAGESHVPTIRVPPPPGRPSFPAALAAAAADPKPAAATGTGESWLVGIPDEAAAAVADSRSGALDDVPVPAPLEWLLHTPVEVVVTRRCINAFLAAVLGAVPYSPHFRALLSVAQRVGSRHLPFLAAGQPVPPPLHLRSVIGRILASSAEETGRIASRTVPPPDAPVSSVGALEAESPPAPSASTPAPSSALEKVTEFTLLVPSVAVMGLIAGTASHADATTQSAENESATADDHKAAAADTAGLAPGATSTDPPMPQLLMPWQRPVAETVALASAAASLHLAHDNLSNTSTTFAPAAASTHRPSVPPASNVLPPRAPTLFSVSDAPVAVPAPRASKLDFPSADEIDVALVHYGIATAAGADDGAALSHPGSSAGPLLFAALSAAAIASEPSATPSPASVGATIVAPKDASATPSSDAPASVGATIATMQRSDANDAVLASDQDVSVDVLQLPLTEAVPAIAVPGETDFSVAGVPLAADFAAASGAAAEGAPTFFAPEVTPSAAALIIDAGIASDGETNIKETPTRTIEVTPAVVGVDTTAPVLELSTAATSAPIPTNDAPPPAPEAAATAPDTAPTEAAAPAPDAPQAAAAAAVPTWKQRQQAAGKAKPGAAPSAASSASAAVPSWKLRQQTKVAAQAPAPTVPPAASEPVPSSATAAEPVAASDVLAEAHTANTSIALTPSVVAEAAPAQPAKPAAALTPAQQWAAKKAAAAADKAK